MAHTPGPWTARQCDGQILLNGSNCYEVREIFNPQGGFNPDDIRLIAAAPELLAALNRIVDVLITRSDWQSGNIQGLEDAVEMATSVIDKAEGRSADHAVS